MELTPSSDAIREACLDFGDSAEHARGRWCRIEGLSKTQSFWEATRLHFLTESIQPRVVSTTRPRVMLLFSNPHPESVETGLFMSETNSRQFWGTLRCIGHLGMTHDFRWHHQGVLDTVSVLLNGAYGDDSSPLLFFECLYPVPSKSPKDLRRLFADTAAFDHYLHRPAIERIGRVLAANDIRVVLVFTGETFDHIVDRPGISKHSRQIIHSAVKTGDEALFWDRMDKHELRRPAQLPSMKHECTAIKVMDTRAKNWWRVEGRPVFSHVLDHALRYAAQVG